MRYKTEMRTLFIFEGIAYEREGDVDDAIVAYIHDTYPEIIDSDFIAEESEEFAEIWGDVETIPFMKVIDTRGSDA
jgi:hypothetical protein